MTTCQECASEISEAEAFCPYCGIKIERSESKVPVAAAEEFESTIMITPEEAAALQTSKAVDTSPSNTPPSPFDTPDLSRKTLPTLEDIPAPSILSSGYARPTDPQISVDLESQPTKETPVYFDEPSDEAEEKSVSGESDSAVNEPGESYREPEPEVDLPVELEPEPTVDSGALVLREPETPIVPSDIDDYSGVDETDPEPQQIETETSSTPDTTEPAWAVEPVVDERPVSISKPLEQLEGRAVPSSMFDSVRIMEGEPGQNADNVDTIIPGHGFQLPSITPAEKSPEPEVPKIESGRVADTGLGMIDTDGRKSTKLKPLAEGTILNNRYEIVRKIGGGGMGAVYLASDNNLGGVLRAVKEMVQAHIEEDQQEKAINDFKRESMILSTLDHPSIPTIYDYFYDADEGRFYLVMKYISGGDLASKLRSSPDGKVEELTVTEWAIQLTDVLNYLHNQPSTIVYRDLKPSNIMLDGNSSRVMLIDFGIARNISQKEEKGVTAVGTMGYAPPELFSGNVEPRSDIYSLGSTIFHLLTGADPQSNPLLIFDFQKNPRPRQINSRLSDQMERILMRTVEYNADQRFSSAAELKAVLEEHLANLRSGNLTFGVTEAPVSVSLANQSVFCGFCGQRIVATDLFCAFCGAKQPIAQQGVHSEIYQKSAGTARLVIEGTSELSAPIYALQKDDNLIGRRDPMSNIFPEVDLSKYDPQTKISRRHAKIWRDGTAFMLEDLGSSNGTVVEGSTANTFKLPAHQPYKLASGDRIKIGDTRLHFVVG